MRYIKNFESIKLNGNDGYRKITFGEYANRTDDREALKPNGIDYKTLSKLGFFIYTTFGDGVMHNHKNSLDINPILIIKLYDGWYQIRAGESGDSIKYYECDQLDGLLNCLKKEFNIG